MTQSIGQKFTTWKLIKFALPSMIMMVFMSMYSIVDGIFISRYVNSNALSAVNIVYPAINILYAVGIMLATGGSAVVAKKLGEGQREKALKDFSMLISCGLVVSIIFMGIALMFTSQISRLLGSSDLIIGYCDDYLHMVAFFWPAAMLQALYQSFFITAGKPRLGLILVVMGGLTNAFLDYFFLSIMGMGIEGAALATGIGQMIPAVVGTLYFTFVRKELYFVPFTIHLKTLAQSCANGSSEMVSNLAYSVVTYLFNVILMRMAGEDGVAAIAIILYGQFLFCSLFFGFSMGVAPVISFNYGAMNHNELKKIYKICIHFIIGASIVITTAAILSSDFVIRIFIDADNPAYDMAVIGQRLFSISYLFCGFNSFSSAMFTAFSDGKTSAILSFGRTFFFIVVSLLILPQMIGITGVWLAVPSAEFICIFISIYYHRKKRITFHYA